MLLNTDKSRRTSTLHDEGCRHVPKPQDTQFEPVGSLGRDGGWLSVSSTAEGKAVAKREFIDGIFNSCPYCQNDAIAQD